MFTLLRPEDNIKLVSTDTLVVYLMQRLCQGFQASAASCPTAGRSAGEHSRPGDPLHGGGVNQRSSGHGGKRGVRNGLQPLGQVKFGLSLNSHVAHKQSVQVEAEVKEQAHPGDKAAAC